MLEVRPQAGDAAAERVELVVDDEVESFAAMESDWNRLALVTGDPFLSHEWVHSWWRAYGSDRAAVARLIGGDGELLAAAALCRGSNGNLVPAANIYSSSWDVVARDDRWRAELWHQLADVFQPTLSISRMPASSPSTELAVAELQGAGYSVRATYHPWRPFIPLPATWDEMLSTLSSNSRAQVRKKRRRIERRGELRVRLSSEGTLDEDLDRFFRLEASGWKGKSGTAILSDPRAMRLYTEFAHAASRAGWLRLELLELDGVTLAADYGCVLGDAAFVLKTCFDEEYSRLSPGAVLRAESIRESIGRGLKHFEWLGAPDAYKLHWGGEVREVMSLEAHRGRSLPTFFLRHRLRPALGSFVRRLRA